MVNAKKVFRVYLEYFSKQNNKYFISQITLEKIRIN